MRFISPWLVFACLVAGCGEEPEPVAPSDGQAAAREPVVALPTPPRHVLLLSIDTLRTSRLGCYGHDPSPTPALDRLAREGVRFERAVAPRGATWPTLTSLLTGKYPITHGVRRNGMLPSFQDVMLPKFLKDHGYATAAFLSNYDDALSQHQRRGFDRLVRGRRGGDRDQASWDRRVAGAAIEWIEEHRDDATFTWLHLMNPHRPYESRVRAEPAVDDYTGWLGDRVEIAGLRKVAASGSIDLTPARLDELMQLMHPRSNGAQTYAELVKAQRGALRFDQVLDLIVLADMKLAPEDLGYILARYDAEVCTSDSLIGEVLDALERLQIVDDTMVVFTSDHGEELYDHNSYFFHGASIYNGVVDVPLLFRWPGHVEVGTIQHVVESMDVLPTLLQVVGIERPEDLEGESLVPLLLGVGTYPESVAVTEVYHKHADEVTAPLDAAYAVRDRDWKLIINRSGAHHRSMPYVSLPSGGFRIDREELYDLARDPTEQVNLLASDVDFGAALNALGVGASALQRAEYLGGAVRKRIDLVAAFEGWLMQHGAGSGERDLEVPEELRESLAALGYVETSPHIAGTNTGDEALIAGLAAAMHGFATQAVESEASGRALLLLAESKSWTGDVTGCHETAVRARAALSADERSMFAERLRALEVR